MQPNTILTVDWNFSRPHKISLVADNYDGFCVEVTGLPQAFEQGLSLSEAVKVSDTEDDQDAVAVLHEVHLLLPFHMGSLAEDQLALLLVKFHRHALFLTTSSANLLTKIEMCSEKKNHHR